MAFTASQFDHAGISSGCANCHDGSKARGKSQAHIVTAAPCETCHKNTATFDDAKMDHTGITKDCASCHNGTTAKGKGKTHMVTAAPCETCHKN
ncbi:MAG: cytochrome c3 family protein, partial [Hyphomicrobium sp.]